MLIYMVLLFYILIWKIWQTKGRIILYENEIDVEQRKLLDKQFITASFAGIILLTALRSIKVGPDTNQYAANYYRVCNGVDAVVDMQFELGYRLLTAILSKITHKEQILFAVIALITNIPIARFIYRYSKCKLLSVILYITVGSFTFQLTGLRQSIALAICIIAIDYAKQQKIVPFILAVILAFFFHRSAMMFLPVYFFGSQKVNRKEILLITISFIGVYFSDYLFLRVSSILGYEEYIGSSGVDNNGGWTLIVIMGLTLLLHIVTKKYYPLSNQEENIERMMFAILLVGLGLYLLRYKVRVAERVSLYYRSPLIILLPNSLIRLKVRPLKWKSYILWACGFLSIILFFYWLRGSYYLYYPFWK